MAYRGGGGGVCVIHCTVKFKHSLSNDSAYTVRYVRAIVILIFHTNEFKL